MKFAVSILTFAGTKILGVSRKNDHTDFGLPGGKVEDGETLEDAAHRELAEETGLIIHNLKPIFVRQAREGSEYACITFTGTVHGSPQSLEGAVAKWIEWEELFKGSFGEYNKELHDHLKAIKFI